MTRTALLACASLALLAAAAVSSQTPALAEVGRLEVTADLVAAAGSRLYLAASNTLTVVDISNPASPKRGGSVMLSERIWALQAVGSVVYAAADHAGLVIVDASDAGHPVITSALKSKGQAMGLAVAGTRVAVANLMSGLEIVDAADRSSPRSLGSFFTEGYARDVATAGSLAFVVDQPSGFSIVDMSKPETAMGQLQSAEAPLSVAVDPQAVPPRVVGVVSGRGLSSGGGPLQVYDVSAPSAPVLAGTLALPGRTQRVKIQGSLAYVTAGPEGVHLVSLSDPRNPKLVGGFKSASPVRDVVAAGAFVFVLVGPPVPALLVLRQN